MIDSDIAKRALSAAYNAGPVLKFSEEPREHGAVWVIEWINSDTVLRTDVLDNELAFILARYLHPARDKASPPFATHDLPPLS